MTIGIDILSGAQDDLAALAKSDPDAHAVIMVFLQEAAADQELLDKWTSHGDEQINEHLFNVKQWIDARKFGEIYRIRILNTPATHYRMVYGYHWPRQRFGILAVVLKEGFNYEITDERAQRIRGDWDSAINDFW